MHTYSRTHASVQSSLDFWESAVFNLGHVYRKLKLYAEALKCYERAIGLCPNKASISSAIGFT